MEKKKILVVVSSKLGCIHNDMEHMETQFSVQIHYDDKSYSLKPNWSKSCRKIWVERKNDFDIRFYQAIHSGDDQGIIVKIVWVITVRAKTKYEWQLTMFVKFSRIGIACIAYGYVMFCPLSTTHYTMRSAMFSFAPIRVLDLSSLVHCVFLRQNGFICITVFN